MLDTSLPKLKLLFCIGLGHFEEGRYVSPRDANAASRFVTDPEWISAQDENTQYRPTRRGGCVTSAHDELHSEKVLLEK